MLIMALKDMKSLRNMLDPEEHDDEIFGFHAQQAVEKILKAWLSWKGSDYRYTHDLGELLQQLEDEGEDVEGYWSLVDYTIYGVQFRYEQSGADCPLDRDEILAEVETLLCRATSLIGESCGPSTAD